MQRLGWVTSHALVIRTLFAIIASAEGAQDDLRYTLRLAQQNGSDYKAPVGQVLLQDGKGSENNQSCGADGKCEEHGTGSDHKLHLHLVLVVMFVFLAIGTITNMLLVRWLPHLPYTCAAFLEGMILTVIEDYGHLGCTNSVKLGLDMWQSPDPHLVLYVFLPCLLFADAMNMNTAMLRKCFWQCIILAVPGVIIGTCLTGVVAKFTQHYDWGWIEAMLFGSILSATDPVAVVAIFNSLGVSPRLTMLIGGESLFNDGVAVVIFELLLNKLDDEKALTSRGILEFAFTKIVLGPILGILVGACAVYLIRWTSVGTYHTDSTSQVLITFCVCYISFVLAENFESSGVLAVVVAGVLFASNASQSLLSHESMHTVWHTAEFVGNTLIFMLSGTLFAHSFTSSCIYFNDWILLGVNYVFAQIIRVAMIAILIVPINMVGDSVSVAEAAVMSWSGLRGAIGLLMAVIVNEAKVEGRGSVFPFHVGGIAAMTLLINGTLTPVVLDFFGLTSVASQQQQLLADVKLRVLAGTEEYIKTTLEDEELTDLFKGVEMRQVLQMLPTLKTSTGCPVASEKSLPRSSRNQEFDESKAAMLRSALLRCLMHVYRELAEHHVLAKKWYSLQMLCSSTNQAMLHCERPLSDWDNLKQGLFIGRYQTEAEYSVDFPRILQFVGYAQSFHELTKSRIRACIAFIHAHKLAVSEVCKNFGRDESADTLEEKIVAHESKQQVDAAEAALNSMPIDLVEEIRKKMCVHKVLHFQLQTIERLAEEGILSDKDSQLMIKEFQKALVSLDTDIKDIGTASGMPKRPAPSGQSLEISSVILKRPSSME